MTEQALASTYIVTCDNLQQVKAHACFCRSTDSPVCEQSPAPGAVVVSDKKQSGEYKLLLMKIEVLYTALLDLEADNLKLNALPTGAPLREQVIFTLTP